MSTTEKEIPAGPETASGLLSCSTAQLVGGTSSPYQAILCSEDKPHDLQGEEQAAPLQMNALQGNDTHPGTQTQPMEMVEISDDDMEPPHANTTHQVRVLKKRPTHPPYKDEIREGKAKRSSQSRL